MNSGAVCSTVCGKRPMQDEPTFLQRERRIVRSQFKADVLEQKRDGTLDRLMNAPRNFEVQAHAQSFHRILQVTQYL